MDLKILDHITITCYTKLPDNLCVKLKTQNLARISMSFSKYEPETQNSELRTQNSKLIWACPSEYSGRAIRSCTAEIRQHAAAIPHASLLEAAAGCISCTVYTKLETQNSELETQNSKLKTSLVPHVYLMKNEGGGRPETRNHARTSCLPHEE